LKWNLVSRSKGRTQSGGVLRRNYWGEYLDLKEMGNAT
jgi:hypothetical protein